MAVCWQVVAHHYCAHINQDVRQCVIYDSDKKDARASNIHTSDPAALPLSSDHGKRPFGAVSVGP